MLDILSQVDDWLQQEKRVALATVIDTWGSAPRRVGSKMAVSNAMEMIGSVSGGCVESAVVEESLVALKQNKPRLLHYGVSDDAAWEVGLACGGKISVLVEPLDLSWWELAKTATQNDKTLTTLTVIEGECAGAKTALNADSQVVYTNGILSPEQAGTLTSTPIPAQSGRATLAGYEVMVDAMVARPHLIIIGGVHVAMALQHYARMLGFRITLIDPREAFATAERFPFVDRMFHAYPDKALTEIAVDNSTYLAVLTHDPKIDDPALKSALAGKPAYIGVLSSKRTHEKRIERLTQAGIAAEELARLSTPIGLAIGATTPEEIALAIMAEIVAVKNNKK